MTSPMFDFERFMESVRAALNQQSPIDDPDHLTTWLGKHAFRFVEEIERLQALVGEREHTLKLEYADDGRTKIVFKRADIGLPKPVVAVRGYIFTGESLLYMRSNKYAAESLCRGVWFTITPRLENVYEIQLVQEYARIIRGTASAQEIERLVAWWRTS